MDGVARGFDVHVVVDACKGISAASVDSALAEMTLVGVKIITSDQVGLFVNC